MRRARDTCFIVVAAVLAACGGGGGGVSTPAVPTAVPTITNALQISSDPFRNPSSQHATEVEPDVAAHGTELVSTFQSGRFFEAGASGIGFSTSLDGGRSWHAGILPRITRVQQPASRFDSASDPAVAYDAAHGVWLAATLPVMLASGPRPAVLVSRSMDGVHWTAPTDVGPAQSATDKSWIVCDNTDGSAFHGRCYVAWDDPSQHGLLKLSTSADGGATWTSPVSPSGLVTGIGAIPVVQPNGTVVVAMDDYDQTSIRAFVSRDGGASWSNAVTVSRIVDHQVAGGLRTSPLPAVAADASGAVYVVWQDCRFHAGCSANDLVMARSRNGMQWSRVVRIPIDARGGAVDHFIPGFSADPDAGAGGAHLALAYYYYPQANCAAASCQLDVGFVASMDGGASWTPAQQLAGPMSLLSLPATRDGLMVGDYIATAFSAGSPVAVFAVAQQPTILPFDEAMYVSARLAVHENVRTSHRTPVERSIPGVVSDHPPRRPGPMDEE